MNSAFSRLATSLAHFFLYQILSASSNHHTYTATDHQHDGMELLQAPEGGAEAQEAPEGGAEAQEGKEYHDDTPPLFLDAPLQHHLDQLHTQEQHEHENGQAQQEMEDMLPVR